ncbi:hypothetical protein B2G71_10440 [Novosphingobium sp. PC22D]|nr:hypothetical protein B2G71_10440 [Novosphingobium sp. PC22D]
MPERTILVVDDHPLCAAAIIQALETLDPGLAVRHLASLRDLEQSAPDPSVSLILLDLKLPDATGMQGIGLAKSAYPTASVCVVSGQSDAGTVRQVIAHEADGFIPKSLSYADLSESLERMLQGERVVPRCVAEPAEPVAHLSPAESRIMKCLCLGLQNKQIAYELGISESTVKSHLAHIFAKLRVQNRSQAIVVFTRRTNDDSFTDDGPRLAFG